MVDDFGEVTRISRSSSNLAAVPNAGQVCLVQIHGPEMGRLYDIGPGGAEMGRGEGAEISIALSTFIPDSCRDFMYWISFIKIPLICSVSAPSTQ